MEEALSMAAAKDTKSRMAGVERLHQTLESSTKNLSSSEVTSLVDCCMDLLKDTNFRVSQGALQAISSAAVLSGEHLKLHFNGVLPAVVEKLGDGKQPVRDAARQLIITLMEISSPTIIVERAGSFAWNHKNWRVREEFARTVAAAVGLFASTELPLQRALLPPILQLLSDTNYSVREAAASCIEEMYRQGGLQFREELQRQYLPSSMMKEINSRLEKIKHKANSTDSVGSLARFNSVEIKSINPSHKKGSPKAKSTPRETSFFGGSGEADVTEKPVDPIKVYSDKELTREFENILSTLVPEKDWSPRIAAMQRIEGLIFGGAVSYPSFPVLLKQLIHPLTNQLLDRRSTIVKQACHLLNLLSKELLGDFESCAELFIPVLFKLVVITVLVIAESADNCIKTMLRNCKVARVLPKVADAAKNDRSAILRARCCEYALLILEHWADEPEIQRSAELYEDLIRCCVADAMGEVRSTARTCYRMFTRTWPERSRRLFSSFDPVIQRIINDEDGGPHKRYTSPSLRERGTQLSSVSCHLPASNAFGYSTSAIVAKDKNSTGTSGSSLFSGPILSQSKASGNSTDRNLESMLQASKQKVSAIESLLRGVNISDKRKSSLSLSTSLDLGGTRNKVSDASNHSLRDPSKHVHQSKLSSNSLNALSLATSRRFERSQDINIEDTVHRPVRRYTVHSEKQFHDTQYKDAAFRDSHNDHVPNFQRPLLRKQATGRVSITGRNSFDDSQATSTEMSNFVEGPTSLNDALAQGLNSNSDWVAKVSAFNFLQNLLQQGSKGIQEVAQNFEKVMKLFFKHLDDPHHKVAQAALSTLAEIIPTCRKPFESYLERTLPHVFSRLIDPKESVRQPCTTTLDIVIRTYSIDSLLPALLRSLDEQRSPKAKLAVIDFANNSFDKHAENSVNNGNSGFLKLWLAKLAPLVNDKNTKLKEASISGIISVYTHFDSAAVLNFVLSLPVEEQNTLRRALKQYTPRIEVDLMNFLQSKKERARSKSINDQSDVIGTSSEECYIGTSQKSLMGRYSAVTVDSDGGQIGNSMQESSQIDASIGLVTSSDYLQPFNRTINIESDIEKHGYRSRENKYNSVDRTEGRLELEGSLETLCLDNDKFMEEIIDNIGPTKNCSQVTSGPSIPQILRQICSGSDDTSAQSKREALQKLIEASMVKDNPVWTKHFNQILTAVLDVLDDPDSSTKELALSLIEQMLNNLKEAMEDCIEIVIEKLLHAAKDEAAKVSNEAQQCMTSLLTQYDPFRCLSVIIPLLVSDDEKTLVISINCMTKLVGRLSQADLMTQLPSFLTALFDAFGNKSPDVRKSVVFCLVDIYIMLGKSFLPSLERLSSTQLRLVTIYANRISLARSGTTVDSNP